MSALISVMSCALQKIEPATCHLHFKFISVVPTKAYLCKTLKHRENLTDVKFSNANEQHKCNGENAVQCAV